MQAYAYCGCYYTLPASLADCANEQLQIQPQGTATVSPTSARATAIPTASDAVASAASADEEATPAVLSVSGGAASLSSQSTVAFSDPRIPSAPTVRITSLKWAIPSSDLGTAWTPGATPSTSSDPIAVVVTYTTTFTAAGYTTTATLSPASLSTVHTCADGVDVTLPDLVSAASALTGPTPIVAAPVGLETFAPPSAEVPAQSTRAKIVEGTTEQTGSREPSTSSSVATPAQSTGAKVAEGATEQTESPEISTSTYPSMAAPALSTGFGPPEAPAGRNGSAVCARCRRASKIF